MRILFALLLVVFWTTSSDAQILNGQYSNVTFANGISWSMCAANQRPAVNISSVFPNPAVSADFVATIRTTFPETLKPNPLIINTNTDVYLQTTSDNAVFNLTYILSITGNKNSFGYFILNQTSRGIAAPGPILLYNLLKDVAPVYGPAGCMNAGYTVTLGPFPANTIIGFYILVNAWTSTTAAVNTATNKILYSLTTPLITNYDGFKHTSWAQFDDRVVFGFEDGSLGDADYNDVMFFFNMVSGSFNSTPIPPVVNGTVQGCLAGSLLTTATSSCFQYALLEASGSQACASFTRIPAGFSIASPTANVLADLTAVGASKFVWSGSASTSFLIMANGACYLPSGAPCSTPMIGVNTFIQDNTCFAPLSTTPCKYRILLRSNYQVSGCTGFENKACSINTNSFILTRNPTTITTSATLDPTSYTVFLSNTISSPLLVPFSINVVANSARRLDLFVAFDAAGFTAAEWSTAKTEFNTLVNLVASAYSTVQVGYAVLRGTSVDTVALSTDRTSIITQFNNAALGTATVASILPSVTTIINTATIGWRSNLGVSAFSALVIVTKNPTSFATGASQFIIAASTANVVPFGISITGSTTLWNALNIPFGGFGESTTFPSFATRVNSLIATVSASASITSSNPGLTSLITPITLTSTTTGVNWLNVTMNFPLAQVPTASPMVFPFTIWGYGVARVNVIVNSPPVIQPTTFTFNDDSSLTFSLGTAITDADSNTLTFTFTSIPVNAIISVTGGATVTSTATSYPISTSFTIVNAVNFYGNLTVPILASDGCATTAGSIQFNIIHVNRAPTVQSFTFTMNRDEPNTALRTINFANFIADIDSPTPQVFISTLPSSTSGRLFGGASFGTQLTAGSSALNNRVLFTPTLYYYGNTTFNFYAQDTGLLQSNVGTVTVVVNFVNYPPTSSNVTLTVDQNAQLTINQISATDIDNDPITMIVTKTTSKGTLRRSNGNSLGSLPATLSDFGLIYNPATNENGSPYTTFEYKFNDGKADSPTYVATINVNFVNQAPTASDFTATTNEGTTVTLPFSSNVADFEGTPLQIIISTLPDSSLGKLMVGNTQLSVGASIAATSTVTFVPVAYVNRLWFGNPTFRYQSFDGQLSSGLATVTIVINPVNNAPTISASPTTVSPRRVTGGSFTFTMQDFDWYDNLTLVIVGSNLAAPSQTTGALKYGSTTLNSGSLTNRNVDTLVNANGSPLGGSLTWIPGDLTPDSFSAYVDLAAMDQGQPPPSATSASVRVTLKVASNQPPTVVGSYNPATDEDTTINAINLKGTDPDSNVQATKLSITFVTSTTSGELWFGSTQIAPGSSFTVPSSTDASSSTYSVSYKPYLNNPGDSFSFYFTDPLGASSATTVVPINVTHVNHPPTTNDFSITLDQNAMYTFGGFPANDVDNIDTLSLVIVSLPTKGTLKTSTGGAISAGQVFAPNVSWKLQYTPVLNENGDGYSQFTFKIRDSSGAANRDSTTATVTINVNFVNQPPTGSDTSLSTDENTPITIDFSGLVNDIDNAKASLKIRINSLPSNTIAALRQSSSSTTDDVSVGTTLNSQSAYLRLVNYKYGTVSFTYSVFDGLLLSTSTYTVQVTINHVNHPPTITSTSATVLADRLNTRTFSLYVQDFDVGDTLSVSASNNNVAAADGTVAVVSPALTIGTATVLSITSYSNNDGTSKRIDVSWTPSASASNSLNGQVTFTVTDQGTLSSSVTVGLTVSQNKPPVAYQTVAVTTNEDTTFNGIRIEGYDPDAGQGTTLVATLLTTPKLGTLVNGGNDVTSASALSSASASSNTTYYLLNYRPTLYTYGSDSFSFYFTDVLGSTSNVITVSITINHVNHPPSSTPFSITLDENTIYTITQFTVSDPDKIDTQTLVITKLPPLGSLLPAVSNTAYSTVPTNIAAGSWQIRYSPVLNGYGTPYTYFSFKMLDSAGAYSPEYNVTVNVNFVNQAPTGASFSVSGTEDIPLVIDFTNYISDVDNIKADLMIQFNTLPSSTAGSLIASPSDTVGYTTFQLFSNKTVIFSSNTYWNGVASFTYSVYDGALYSATTYTVTINMAAVNNPPTVSVSPLSVVSTRNSAAVFTVTVQDVDVGDAISVFLANHTLPANTNNGVVKLVGGTALTNTASQLTLKSNMANPSGSAMSFQMSWTASDYAPDNLVISFNIFATDNGQPPPSAASNFVNVKLTVTPNTAPTSSASPIVLDEDGSIIFTLTGTDADSSVHATTLKIMLVSLPQLGTLLQSPSNTSVATATAYAGTAGSSLTSFNFVYIPKKITYGSDSFSYVVQDVLSASSTVVTVPITINHVNHAPSSRNLNVTTNENFAYTFSSFPADDVDVIDTLSLVIVSLPTIGTLKDASNGNIAAGRVFSPSDSWNLQFIPVLNGYGTPYTTFTFKIRDSSGAVNNESPVYTCTINVNFVNQPPTASDVEFDTLEDTPVALLFSSSVNDVDNTVGQLQVVIASLPSNGQLIVTTGGAKVTQGQKISASVSQISYSPYLNSNGDDSFTWYAVDPSGLTSSVVTATIHVQAVNDPPISADKVVVTARDTPVVIKNFVAEDVDNEPEDISLTVITNVDAGTLDMTTSSSPANAVSFTYTPPNLDSIYVDPAVPFTRFTFRLFDGTNDSSVYTVSIYISYSNTMPKSQDDVTYTDEDIPVLVTLSATDLETPVANLTIKIVSIDPSTIGTLYTDETMTATIEANAFLPNKAKSFYYVPVLNTYTIDDVPLAKLKFQVYDTEGGISVATYTALVFVNHINKPAAYNGPLRYRGDEDATLTMNLGAAIKDPDSPPPAQVQITQTVDKGSFFVCEADVEPCNRIPINNGDYIDNLLHQVMFAPLPNENGDNYTTYSFVTYDSEGLQSATYTVTIDITPVNDPPVVVPFYSVVPQRVVMDEDTEYVLPWNVTDIDSPTTNLTTKITSTLPANAALYLCDTSNGEECARGEQIVPPAFVPAITPGIFKVLFVPEANAYDDRNFATFSVQAYDDYEAPSSLVRAIIRVRPVNDAPTISSNSTSVTAVKDSNTGLSRTGFGAFVVADIDSGLKPISMLITVQDPAGYFDLVSNFNPCTFINGTDAITANCTTSQVEIRALMPVLYFVTPSVGSLPVAIVVDDLGHISWNDSALTAEYNFTILIAQDTGLLSTPTTPDNTLTIALSVSAGAAVAGVAVLVWRLRRKKNAEVDDYFEDLTSNMNATTTSALYQSKFQDGSNPFYQNNNA